MNLGLLIRRYRKERKFTLKAVAEKARISEGFLSQVENNVSTPSLATLVHIGNAIGINAGDLLNQVNKQEDLAAIRKREWVDVDIPHTGFVTRRFFPPENRTALDSAILFIKPEKSIPVRKNVKNGQELLCVLKGSVELVHGDRTLHMSAGDAVHYWSNLEKQSITNKSKGLAIVFWVGTL